MLRYDLSRLRHIRTPMGASEAVVVTNEKNIHLLKYSTPDANIRLGHPSMHTWTISRVTHGRRPKRWCLGYLPPCNKSDPNLCTCDPNSVLALWRQRSFTWGTYQKVLLLSDRAIPEEMRWHSNCSEWWRVGKRGISYGNPLFCLALVKLFEVEKEVSEHGKPAPTTSGDFLCQQVQGEWNLETIRLLWRKITCFMNNIAN